MKTILAHLKPPSLFIFFSLMAGIALGDRLPDFKTYIWLVLAVLSGLSILAACFHKQAFFPLFLFLICGLGMLSIQTKLYPDYPEDHIRRFFDLKKTCVKGKIVSFSRHYDKKIKVTLECKNAVLPDQPSEQVSGRIELSIYLSSGPIPQYGDTIEFESTLRPVQNFENPGAFDYVRYFKLKGLDGAAYCDQKNIRIIHEKKPKNIFLKGIRAIEKIRLDFYRFIFDHAGPSESTKALAALITGKTELISPDLRELFSKAGISHLFAISGLHLSIIGYLFFNGIFYFLSIFPKFLITGRSKKLAGAITVVPLMLYCIFSGFSPSTQRAFIMTLAVLFSLISEKEKDFPSSISMAGILILIIDSAALFSISFQLSFIAVGFIMAGLSLVKKGAFPYKDNFLGKTALLLCVSLFASLGTFPLTAHYFHTVSMVQLISNLVFIPVVGFVILPLGIVSLLGFSFIPVFSGWIIHLCHFLISFSILSSKAFVSIPFSWVRTMSLDGPEIILIYLMFVFFYTLVKQKRKISATILVVMGILVIYNLINDHSVKKTGPVLAITIMDVGQGNSSLIQTPQGHHILVDGGGFPDLSDFDTGKYIIAPFLWKNKIDTLNYIILSHPESDHLNGLIYIVENFRIHTLIKNSDMTKTEAYKKLMEICKKKNIRIWEPSGRGEAMYLGETAILFSEKADHSVSDDLNNNSLVFRISYKRFSMLFPGDILSAREKHLAKGNGLNLQSKVLLSPHHGSSSSSTEIFLDKVMPKSVIISCGRNNRYKFPHPDVLKRYKNMGIHTFRTDKDGAVFISSDGLDYGIKTHKGG
ncbi:MAG: DNA internalization-related competence protein ComEC/Rec2 [Desulfobacteraceae bacterium]|nr:DNA internalization-related competence protein ComEC/Rec2 [Desulfobacteraceae bacterium]